MKRRHTVHGAKLNIGQKIKLYVHFKDWNRELLPGVTRVTFILMWFLKKPLV